MTKRTENQLFIKFCAKISAGHATKPGRIIASVRKPERSVAGKSQIKRKTAFSDVFEDISDSTREAPGELLDKRPVKDIWLALWCAGEFDPDPVHSGIGSVR